MKQPLAFEQYSAIFAAYYGFIFYPLVIFALTIHPGFQPIDLMFVPLIGFLLVAQILIFNHFKYAFGYVELNRDGVTVKTRRKATWRQLTWDEISRFVVTQDHADKVYICISSNKNLHCKHTHMHGALWAMAYDKQTISFKATTALIACCHAHLSERGIEMEKTGLGAEIKDVNMMKALKKDARQSIITTILVCFSVLAAFVVFAFCVG